MEGPSLGGDDGAHLRPCHTDLKWTIATTRWEGSFWWHDDDVLTRADPGAARLYAGYGERHVGRIAVKVAQEGGQLWNDGMVWTKLQEIGGFAGLPRLHAHLRGVGASGQLDALACELCGPSLAWHASHAPFGWLAAADVCAVGAELFALIGRCHAAGYAHRDITPANLLTPLVAPADGGAALLLIDFGIAKPLPQRGAGDVAARHAAKAQDESGTLRFATPHLGVEPLAPRDDVLGACFALLSLAGAPLPWDAEVARAQAPGVNRKTVR
ncbi:hypothetical protein T492DRAFT_875462, partial [Pavlovales sp. CCMP2436]